MPSTSRKYPGQGVFHSNNQEHIMKNYNQVNFKGPLGRDARINNAGSRRVANFSVATEYNIKKNDGSFVNETTWLNVCAWQGYGICDLDELKKGVKVCGNGRLRTRKYTDNSGEEHEITEVVVDSLDIISDTPQESAQKPARMESYQSGKGNYHSNDEDVF